MRTVTRIRVAICSMMLACTGMLSVPLAAHAEGDAAAGEKIFAHCAPCHSTKPGENKVGPSLAGIFGRKSGTEPGYSYSSAIKGLNVTWDEANLNEWLQGPSKFAKGKDDLLRAGRERSAGRDRLSEGAAEIVSLVQRELSSHRYHCGGVGSGWSRRFLAIESSRSR
jgi:cytochrome c